MSKRDNDILLNTGINEFEMLEFVVAGNHFGINVAKVRELIRHQPVQRIPHSKPGIEGIMNSRNELYTVVDLAEILNLPASNHPADDIFIITEFNKISVAFHVHMVVSIHHISWDMVEKPDSSLNGNNGGLVTGIAKLENKIIPLIDFEKIMYDINPDSGLEINTHKVANSPEHGNSLSSILIAEDSPMLNKVIINALHNAGYQNIIRTSNGQEAWEYLKTAKENPGSIACVITDIEMPRMDGHHLTKLIKEDSHLSVIPVVIFSSIITDVMRLKGEKAGADAQLSKPELDQLVQTIDRIIRSRQTQL